MAKIKICGLTSQNDIDFVNEGRPDYCGFIINVPKSRRNVTPETVRALTGRLHGSVIPVGVFVNSPIADIIPLVKDGAIRAVQLHGSEDDDYVNCLRRELDACRGAYAPAGASRGSSAESLSGTSPGTSAGASARIPIIQAFQIASREDVRAAAESAADFILLDNGTGGTGRVFDWSLLEEVKRPFFLAGGLTPENLAAAIKNVRPYAVDISSGVESAHHKDKNKILAAIAAVRS